MTTLSAFVNFLRLVPQNVQGHTDSISIHALRPPWQHQLSLGFFFFFWDVQSVPERKAPPPNVSSASPCCFGLQSLSETVSGQQLCSSLSGLAALSQASVTSQLPGSESDIHVVFSGIYQLHSHRSLQKHLRSMSMAQDARTTKHCLWFTVASVSTEIDVSAGNSGPGRMTMTVLRTALEEDSGSECWIGLSIEVIEVI